MSKKYLLKRFQFLVFLPCLLCGIIIISSCNNKSSPCGDPAPTIMQIALVDHNDSLLIGKKYIPDSIQLIAGNKKLNITVEKGFIIVNYGSLEIYNSDNYFLYLSKADTDTLNIQVNDVYNKDCDNYYPELGAFQYNFKTISPDTYNKFVFKIIKE